jgi:hypothetical protein
MLWDAFIDNIPLIIAIARLTLFIGSSIIFILIFRKLKFNGFLSLSIAFLFSAIALLLSETGTKITGTIEFELILLIATIFYFSSAILVYRSLMRFVKDKNIF